MNDTPDLPPASPAPAAAPAPAAPAASPLPPKAKSHPGVWANPWLLVALAAVGLAGWQWLETRGKLTGTQQEVAKRLADSDTLVREARTLARQSQDATAQLTAKVGALEAKLAESQSQQAALENLYQELARNRDEQFLAEIDQNLSAASQQLQLAGNIQAAITALQAAEARLARAEQPRLVPLRKAIARDLDKLKSLPYADVPGMSLRLENAVAAVDNLPLAFETRPRNDEPSKTAPGRDAKAGAEEPGLLARLGSDIWNEVKGLVRIQRFDRPEPALLAPDQSLYLRENLKLRLLNARLALLSRDQWTFRNELKVSQDWLTRFFDGRDRNVATAQNTLKQLASAEISIDLPQINDSLAALKALKQGPQKDRK
ncbi:uroporphyrin-III C-methyltransferase [Oryzomicrobium terrae]|uniref:Uroporphyrin-III C-methyltransferase n=1 Tax=Oryzomicrobium terrae TaxID=1735038 RepID=A0A5C1E548_9RHOO|nr:uroporphyrinogen-III C-methyltransferase [Oryzomicrobium terrae]QEL64051.1 uroporphyrin-III C-methyltransferase [Oryzomicrobium terrae]